MNDSSDDDMDMKESKHRMMDNVSEGPSEDQEFIPSHGLTTEGIARRLSKEIFLWFGYPVSSVSLRTRASTHI